METYSQDPGVAIGPSANVVHISKITPAAPPCITPLRLVYFSQMRNSNVTVPEGVAERIRMLDMKWKSKPWKLEEAAIRRYLGSLGVGLRGGGG